MSKSNNWKSPSDYLIEAYTNKLINDYKQDDEKEKERQKQRALTNGTPNSTNSSTTSQKSSYGSQTGSQTTPAEKALFKMSGRRYTDLNNATARSSSTGNTNKTRTLDRTNERAYNRYDTEALEKTNIRKNYVKERDQFRKEHPVGKWAGAEAYGALTGINSELAKTADFFLPNVITPKKVQETLDYYKRADEEQQKKVEEARGGSVERQIAGTVGGEGLKNIPSALMAMLTGGTSVGAQVAGKAVPTLLNANELAHTGNVVTRAINEVARNTGNNPMFWETFARTIGTTYEKELQNGADPIRATMSAYTNALLNAQIEVGGGIEVYDPSEDFLKALARSAKEEGLEEVQQYAVENLVNKAMGSNGYVDSNGEFHETPWFSLTRGQDAVVNPVDMAEQGFYGALTGGLLSGGRTALANTRANIMDTLANPVSREEVEQGMADQRGLVNRGLVQDRGEEISTKAKSIAQELQAQLDKGEKLQPNQVKRLIREINKESNVNEQSLEKARIREVGKSLDEGSFVEETGLNLEQEISKQKDSALESRSKEKVKAILGENATDNEISSVTKVAIGTANSRDIDTVLTKPSLKNAVAEIVNEGADANSKIQIPISNVEARTVLENLTAVKGIANRNAILKETQEENAEDIKALLTNLNSGGKDLFANHLAEGRQTIGDVYQNRFYRLFSEGTKENADFEDAYQRLITPLGADVEAIFTPDFARQIFAQGKASVVAENAKATAKSLADKYANRTSGLTFEDSDESLISESDKKGLEVLAKAGDVEIRIMKSLTATDKEGKALLTKDGKKLVANGMYHDGIIYISADTKNKLITVAKHELTHYIKEMSPDRYQELEDFVLKKWYKNDPTAFAKRVEEYQRLYKDATPEEAREELIADASEAFFTDGATIQEAVTFSEKLGKAIHDGIKHILGAFTGDNRSYRGYGDFMKDLGILQEAERMWLEALEDSQQRKRNAKGTETKATAETESEAKHSLGYHAGDLGKSTGDDYFGQGYYRGTGHFGFGTYFVGDKAQVGKYGYENRPVESVDFDKYNLYKPRDYDRGIRLHEALKIINGYANNYSELKKLGDYKNEKAREERIYKTSGILRDLDEFVWEMESDDETPSAELKSKIDKYFSEMPEYYRDQIEEKAQRQYERDGGEYDLETERYYVAEDIVKDYISKLESDIDKVRSLNFELTMGLGFAKSEAEIDRALAKTEEIVKGYPDNKRGLDSASTVFMKQLGYEGVDVRGIKGLDNTTYGSVIYDLKDEDLARKKEIGTAKYSLTAEDQDYMDAVNKGDMETAQRMVDEEAKKHGYNSPLLYSGSDHFGFTKIDPYANHGDGSFWASNREDTSGTYTWLQKSRGISQDIGELVGENRDDAYKKLNDAIHEFRLLIDHTFGEWFIGQQDDSVIEDVLGENVGDEIYDAYVDFVADAYEYREENNYEWDADYEPEYEDFADWQDHSEEWVKLDDAISAIESANEAYMDAEDAIEDDMTGGIYQLYANTDNMYEMDAKGALWNSLRPEGLPKLQRPWSDDAPYKTRDVVEWAKNNGYDGVIFRNIKDNGQYGRTGDADVYAFLNPTAQLKSADPVTYDDNGEVIPLSERFNESNEDIRWSVSEDRDYMQAVESNDTETAQRLVDERAKRNGWRPKHTYHGTLAYGFTVFDKKKAHVGGNSGAGFYFSTEMDDSVSHYADIEGADNYFKREALAEQIFEYVSNNEDDYWEGHYVETYEDAEELAKELLNKNPDTYDVYLKYDKPYVRNYRKSTNIYDDIMEDFDPDNYINRSDYDSDEDYEDDLWNYRSEYLYDEIYTAVYNAYTYLENMYDSVDMYDSIEDVANKIIESVYDYESLTWDDIHDAIDSLHGGISIINDDWSQAGAGETEFTRAIIENFGYDAIEDKEVASKFGQLSREMMTDTEHIIVFHPNQIKSAEPITYDDNGKVVPLSKRFNEVSDDIRYSVTLMENPAPKPFMKKDGNDITVGERLFRDVNGNPLLATGFDITADTLKMMGKESEIPTVGRFLKRMAKFMKKMGETYTFIGLDDVNNATLEMRYDKDGNPVSIVVSAMVKNGEYPINFDFSSICKKRQAVSKLFEELSKGENGENFLDSVELTQENLFEINKILSENGYETACLGCFVETKRYNIEDWADGFVEKWNNAVKAINPNAKYFDFASSKDIDYGYVSDEIDRFAENKQSEKEKESKRRKRERDNWKKKWLKNNPSGTEAEAEKAFKDWWKKEYNKKTTDYKESWFENPTLSNDKQIVALVNSSKKMQGLLRKTDLISPKGLKALMALHPDFYGVLYGHYGSGTPKPMVSFTPYNSELALLDRKMDSKGVMKEYTKKQNDKLVNDLVEIGGVRVQSFSDFLIQNVFDYIQMVADMSARDFPAHAYTKEIAFARIFGLTGMKINLSVMFDVDPDGIAYGLDKDGNYVVADRARQEREKKKGNHVFQFSIPYAEAVKLQNQKGYDGNIGIIGVGLSDLHIRKMLNDVNIKMIIPYHASGMPAVIKQLTRLGVDADYTSTQNTLDITKIERDGEDITKQFGKEYMLNLYKEKGSWKEAFKQFRKDTEGCTITTKKAFNSVGDFPLYTGDSTVSLDVTKDPKKTAEYYMGWCIENGHFPLFYQFADEENYYKVLYDFNVYHNDGTYAPQQAVTNTYPSDLAKIISHYMNKANNFEQTQAPKWDKTIEETKEMLKANSYADESKASLSEVEDSSTVGRLQKENATLKEAVWKRNEQISAERMMAEIDVQKAKREANESKRKAVNRTRERYEERIEDLKQRQREKEQRAKERREAQEQREKEHRKQVHERARVRRAESEAKQKAERQAKREEQRAKKQDSKARTRLLEVARRLSKIKSTDEFYKIRDQLIGNLDLEAKSMTGKTRMKLEDLEVWYQDQVENNDWFVRNEALEKKFERLRKTHISDMSLEDVQNLTEILLMLEHKVRNDKKLINSQYKKDVFMASFEASEGIKQSKGLKFKGLHKLDNVFVGQVLSPIRYMRRITGYDEDNPLMIATRELEEGQIKSLDYRMNALKPFNRFTDPKFTAYLNGNKAPEIEVNATTIDMKPTTVKIIPAIRIWFYLSSMNADNMRHIVNGGVRMPDIELLKKGNRSEAYDEGTLVRFSKSQVQAIIDGMTQEEKAYANEVYRYFNEVAPEATNDVSEMLDGISIARVKNYVPIHVDKTFLDVEADTIKRDGTLEGMGSHKERVHSPKPAYAEDISDVVMRAIEADSKYVGMAIPIRNFNKIYRSSSMESARGQAEHLELTGKTDNAPSNLVYGDEQTATYRTRTGGYVSVQDAITKKWTSDALGYIDDFLSDLQFPQSKVGAVEKTLRSLTSNYAGAVLTLNASVALKQSASFPTAGAVLGWKPLIKSFGKVGKLDLEYADSITPLLNYRAEGFNFREAGDIQNRSGRDNWFKRIMRTPALNWIQGMDLLTTRKLFKASEIYVQDKYKLKRGQVGYDEKVAEIFNRVITETQPNYTVMERAGHLRSDSTLERTLSMFKTQPYQNFNIWYDAVGNYLAKKGAYKKSQTTRNREAFKEASVNLGRATTSQIAQLAVFAMMTSLWALARGKDDKWRDEEGNLSFASYLKQLAHDMLGGVASEFFLGSDVFSALDSVINDTYYSGFSSVTDSSINDFFNTGMDMMKLLQTAWSSFMGDSDEEVDIEKIKKQMEKVVTEGGRFSGIPTGNIINLKNLMYRWVSIAKDGEYIGEYEALKMSFAKDSAKKELLNKAYRNDPEAYEELREMMIEDGMSESTLKDYINKSARENPTEAQTNSYQRSLEFLEGNSLWYNNKDSAYIEDYDKDLRDIALGISTSNTERLQKLESVGISPEENVLIRLAMEKADKLYGDKNGSLNKSEKERALEMVRSSLTLTESQKKAILDTSFSFNKKH